MKQIAIACKKIILLSYIILFSIRTKDMKYKFLFWVIPGLFTIFLFSKCHNLIIHSQSSLWVIAFQPHQFINDSAGSDSSFIIRQHFFRIGCKQFSAFYNDMCWHKAYRHLEDTFKAAKIVALNLHYI